MNFSANLSETRIGRFGLMDSHASDIIFATYRSTKSSMDHRRIESSDTPLATESSDIQSCESSRVSEGFPNVTFSKSNASKYPIRQ